MKIDYNKMAQQVHEENKAKGFYDIEPSKGMSLLLIVSELVEMVEADRKGKHAVTSLIDGLLSLSQWDVVSYCCFTANIKDTIEDEAADVILRILDYAGWQNIDIDSVVDFEDFREDLPKEEIKASEIFKLINIIEKCTDNSNVSWLFGSCMLYFVDVLQIDIWKHVELKRKYNKLRPIRNGKKY